MTANGNSSKKPRRGLKKAVEEVLKKGLTPLSFGVDDIRKGLDAEGWVYDADYNMNSMVHAIRDICSEQGCVKWEKNVRSNADKAWSYTPAQSSSSVAPSHEMIAKIVDEIADNVQADGQEEVLS